MNAAIKQAIILNRSVSSGKTMKPELNEAKWRTSEARIRKAEI